MARKGLIGSLFTVTAAAAAVAGVAYLFKEEIRETKTYKDLNDKYDVDRKIKEYSVKARALCSRYWQGCNSLPMAR